jgi:CheY-like chemotaxis protein
MKTKQELFSYLSREFWMSSQPINVLIVNDQEDVVHLWKRIINITPNIRCEAHAVDGEQAIEMTRALQPDVVVMDIMMPKIDGLEATRQIRAEFPEIVIVVFSARQGMTELAFEAGAHEFVLLPIYPDQLIATIQRVYSEVHNQA